ncbi:MAG: hypothetical protein GY854_09425 [Deltaproteobacteria bacterium]|nr:hypothetical protein [Deltaproteobacteria bacterium]
MKTILLIIGGLVLAVGLFVGGFAYGRYGASLDPEFHISTLDQVMAEAAGDWATMYQLDNGRVDEAKSALNSGLDGYIMTIDQLSRGVPNEESKVHARCILQNIAKHRDMYPPFYGSSEHDEQLTEGKKEVQRILEAALSEETCPRENCSSRSNDSAASVDGERRGTSR